MKQFPIFSIILSISLLAAIPASGQYFGRNNPRYQKQPFKVTQTQHFDIYEYLKNPEKLKELAAASELWYTMHQAVLQDTFTRRNPLIIYNDHAGFQQNNTLGSQVNVGTGGVTEGLRNRVLFPVAMTNQQTHHVLGHELVHAFQYNMILRGDSTNMQSLGNLPLWMVEGLAEYLAIGRVDAHTALWMRDAVIHDKLPKRFRDLDRGNYFPYRWGQAFWAFVTGVYGDEAVKPLFVNTAKYGLDEAIVMTLAVDPDTLASAWTRTLRSHYSRFMLRAQSPNKTESDLITSENAYAELQKSLGKKQRERPMGRELISDDNAGRLNISPVLSPNGKYVIFLSEKSLFSTDLFLADAKTGKIIRKVASAAQDGHIDQYNYIESAGTWAPDDKRFAFDVYKKGRSTLVIKDALKGRTIDEVTLTGVPTFSNPAWSPDGKTIVVTGLVNGQTDLYAYDVRTKKVRRLTNDRFAEILPSWSKDSKTLIFSTDQLSMERGRTNGAWVMNLAAMDVATGETDLIDVFTGADNLNPHFDKAGNIVFLSNRDGFRNLYRYEMASKKVYQLTNLLTGITGITAYAPAITVAEDRDRMLYTYYAEGQYRIYEAKSTDFTAVEVDASRVDMVPGTLPPFDPRKRDVVNTNLRTMDSNLKTVADTNTLKAKPYRPKFSLNALSGGAGTGVGLTGNNASFGNAVGIAGGINAFFSDILDNNQLGATVALNGDIQDFAGLASYINNKGRFGWGFGVSHIPFQSFNGYQFSNQPVPVDLGDGRQGLLYEEILSINRTFNQRFNATVFYPFSTTQRIELNTAVDLYSQRSTTYFSYYDDPFGQFLRGQRQERGPRSGRFNLNSINAAWVGDNSYFGATAPLQGSRWRVSAEQFIGQDGLNFSAVLLDGRKYVRLRPVTFAFRGLAYTRLGQDANALFPLFVTQPFFIRGYNNNFVFEQNPNLAQSVAGSKMGVANFEIRLPFTGPKGYAALPVNFLLSDLNLFVDAGIAVNEFSQLRNNGPDGATRREPLLSAGISLRVNLFGALILEPFYALPLSLSSEQRQWQFGLNIIPGW